MPPPSRRLRSAATPARHPWQPDRQNQRSPAAGLGRRSRGAGNQPRRGKRQTHPARQADRPPQHSRQPRHARLRRHRGPRHRDREAGL